MARAVPDQSLTGERGGSIGLVLLIAIVLMGAAAGLIALGRAHAEPYVLALLSVLAMVGVFLLFALSAGLLRTTSGNDRTAGLTKSVVQGAREGILVTDAQGRVVFANRAYLDLT